MDWLSQWLLIIIELLKAEIEKNIDEFILAEQKTLWVSPIILRKQTSAKNYLHES